MNPSRPKPPIPAPPPKGRTYAIDGPSGRRVRTAPAGMCGRSCRTCWPYPDFEEDD